MNLLRQRLVQCRKAAMLLWHPAFRRGLRHGVAASLEHRHQLAGLSLSTVVDVGANRGQFTLLMRTIYPSCRVFAFEPLARPARTYRQLFERDPLVHFHQCAIAPRAGRASMHVARQDDSSSLLPISTRQVQFDPGTGEVAREEVALSTLDRFLSPPDLVAPALLKLDVQGYELEALKGSETLLPLFDYVYAELSFVAFYEGQPLADEVIEWLAARAFRVAGINPYYDADRRVVQADFMFRRSRAARLPAVTQ